jgi:hypothetical protein
MAPRMPKMKVAKWLTLPTSKNAMLNTNSLNRWRRANHTGRAAVPNGRRKRKREGHYLFLWILV